MRIWIDDVRPAPEGYKLIRTVNDFINYIELHPTVEIELIDLDHDSGEFALFGGDYIQILNYLEETGRNYPIRIHSMNSVGVENMRRIIQRNGWTEIK